MTGITTPTRQGGGLVCICYYTFWSGVADLSARYPRARAPEGGGRINRNTTTKGVIKCLLQVARWFGVISWQRSRKRPCTVRILVRSLPCFVSVSQWRRLLPAFSAPSGLCCRSFPCLTERWTELESENEPPRKRKRLSLRRKENKPITGDGGRRVGAPSGSLSFGCSGDAFS